MRIVLAAVLLAASLLVTAGAGAAERKVALVIGNGDYFGAGVLANTVNDAAAVADKLKGLGFEVSLVTDADRRGAIAAIDDFSRSLQGADVAFLFYAGHGMQIEGDNSCCRSTSTSAASGRFATAPSTSARWSRTWSGGRASRWWCSMPAATIHT